VFERQGQQLRVFENNPQILREALSEFAKDYTNRRIFPSLKRLTVKQYPQEAAALMEAAGFTRVMGDFALYQGYL
jgi:ATP-dependent Lhr-like helicase